MVIGRLLGWLLLLFALGLGAHDAFRAFNSSRDWRFLSGGEFWFSLNPNTLVGFQALIEKHIAPDLWRLIVLPILTQPAWAVPLVPGLALAVLCRRRRRTRPRR
jgi:hypothetical protein